MKNKYPNLHWLAMLYSIVGIALIGLGIVAVVAAIMSVGGLFANRDSISGNLLGTLGAVPFIAGAFFSFFGGFTFLAVTDGINVLLAIESSTHDTAADMESAVSMLKRAADAMERTAKAVEALASTIKPKT